jgi:DNA-binding IclR family transcriptional regulator
VLLSFIDESEAIAILKRVSLNKITPNTIVNPKILLKQLHEIKKQGYGYSMGEINPLVHSISAPLFNGRGSVEEA